MVPLLFVPLISHRLSRTFSWGNYCDWVQMRGLE